MARVAPTILAATPKEYALRVDRVKPFAKLMHIDVCDGVFVEQKTVSLARVYDISGIPFDLHLMMSHPDRNVAAIISLQPRTVIFHYEAAFDHASFIKELHLYGIKAGMAITQATAIKEVADLVEKLDHVLIFTGTLGMNGSLFDHSQLAKIPAVRAVNPKIEIGVDGGVNLDNAVECLEAGANILNVGSCIHSSAAPATAHATLRDLASEY